MKKQLDHIGSSNFGEMFATPSLFRRIVYGVLPAHIWNQIRFEWRATKVRRGHGRMRRHFAEQRGLLVNIGSGKMGKEGWINVDLFPARGVNCVYDSRKSLPFANESVKAIFTEHFFEHIDYTEEVPLFLRECWRVLEPGGVIRIIVPDSEKYIRAYCEGWDALRVLRGVKEDGVDPYFPNTYKNAMELFNTVFRQEYQHKWMYDFDNLRDVLEHFGFADVARCVVGESRLEGLAIDTPARAHESLYVEASKPKNV